jgi:hypothetical protein
MPGTISTGGNILYCWMISIPITPTSVAANTTVEQSFTVPGLQIGDFIDVYSNALQTAGIGICNNRVSAANTLQLGFQNSTAGALTPVAGAYVCVISRPESLPLPSNAN